MKEAQSAKIIQDQNTLMIEGEITLHSVSFLISRIQTIAQDLRESVTIDLKNTTKIDTAGIAFLKEIDRLLKQSKIHLSYKNTPQFVKNAIKTFDIEPDPACAKTIKPPHKILFESIGELILYKWDRFIEFLYLLSDVADYAFVGLLKRSGMRKGEFYNQCVLIGMNALPIVALISFLIGFILALQSAAQLRQFGASIYVADLIAVSMTREMGPLMTAIILSGRSGSSITSELATMVVTEETDALKSMGLNPIRYIVIPKVLAISLTTPILTVFSMIIGILGALVIGVTYLQIGVDPFINEVIEVLVARDIYVGLFKSLIFALLIVVVATYYGLTVKGGAADVGKATTSSVVASIFCVILADSILGLLFYFGQSIVIY